MLYNISKVSFYAGIPLMKRTNFVKKIHVYLFLDDLDKELVSSSWLTYIPGKSDHLVPLIFPRDCFKALKHLLNALVRTNAGVAQNNNYLFPSTHQSERLDNVCAKLNLENRNKIKATKNRHRVSTLYSSFELNIDKRHAFHDHMGHTKEMNEKRYTYFIMNSLFSYF